MDPKITTLDHAVKVDHATKHYDTDQEAGYIKEWVLNIGDDKEEYSAEKDNPPYFNRGFH